MASGERARRKNFASRSPMGPIYGGQKLQRSKQASSLALPWTAHRNPAPPLPRHQSTRVPGFTRTPQADARPEEGSLLPTLWKDGVHSQKRGNRSHPQSYSPSTSHPKEQLTFPQAHNNRSHRKWPNRGTDFWRWAHLGGSQLTLGQTSGVCCWQEGGCEPLWGVRTGKWLTSWTCG